MSQINQSTRSTLSSRAGAEQDIAPTPPSTLFADEADEALAVTKYQQELLDRAEHYLKRLRLLAAISYEAENPDHNLLNTEFRQLEKSLGEVLGSELNNRPVFRRGNYSVDLNQGGNKLVLPGVHSLRSFLPKLQKASILDKATAEQALETVKTAFKHVAMDEAVSIENGTRLTFLTRHFEEVKETL